MLHAWVTNPAGLAASAWLLTFMGPQSQGAQGPAGGLRGCGNGVSCGCGDGMGGIGATGEENLGLRVLRPLCRRAQGGPI